MEGRNLTNAIARTYLNGNPCAAVGAGQLVGQNASGVGGATVPMAAATWPACPTGSEQRM